MKRGFLNIKKNILATWAASSCVCFMLMMLPVVAMSQTMEPVLSRLTNDKYGSPKFSPALRQKLAQINDTALIHVEILAPDSFPFRQWCLNHNLEITGVFPIGRYTCFTSMLSKKEILLLDAENGLLAAELVRTPLPELKQEGLDLSLNEISLLHAERKDLAGTYQVLSLKEHLFDTTDIDFRGRYFLTGLTSSLTQIHATNMATISAGGGNADITSKGVAWDADLTSANFDTLLPNADSYFETYDINVQNHSYGTGIENYYGIETLAYDASCNRMPSLIHIFSSGNDGDQTPNEGMYAGLSGWANITGQFKQSKNTVTAGATDSLAIVLPYSSRGPAYDGRIKPEVVTYGHGGTSGSAALLSGLCILLQEEYKRGHANELPPASLIKAILANTAKDIGRPGPDFESGFGSVRGYEAIKVLDKNQMETGQVSQGDFYTHVISIPEGVGQVKITLAWTDPAASVNASAALVNDMDLECSEITSGQSWQPWVLNSFPKEDSLKLPAKRGIDTLNNIEQITIDNPGAGQFEIRVHGKKISNGSQPFSVTWWYEENESFQWVFPTSLDYLKPDEPNLLRWATGGEQKGKIEYKPVSQEDWHILAEEVDPVSGSYNWNPSAETGLIQLRWSNPDTFFISDTFVLGDQLRPKVGLVCPDSLLFYWSPVENADSFEILALGERHLEHVGFTRDTFYISHDPESLGYHYAIAPVYKGIPGPRSYGFDYRTQGAGCYINQFFLLDVQDGVAFLEADLGTLYNVESVILEKLDGNMYTPRLMISPVMETKLLFETDDLDQGANYFRLMVVLNNGSAVRSEDVVVYNLIDHEILAFPNPVMHGYELQILVKRGETFTLKIADMLGREVICLPETTNPQSLNISNLAAGQYIAIVRFENGDIEAVSFMVRD